jgi:hypothetical protein
MMPASSVHRIRPPYPNLSMTLNTTGFYDAPELKGAGQAC